MDQEYPPALRSDRRCALHKVPVLDFSVQPLCSLCLCGVFLLGIHQPQRHREHGGCTKQTHGPLFALTLV